MGWGDMIQVGKGTVSRKRLVGLERRLDGQTDSGWVQCLTSKWENRGC